MCCGKRWFWRSQRCEEWTLVDSLFATQEPDDIQAWATAYSYIWVCSSQGLCWCSWPSLLPKPWVCPGCGPPPVSMGCAATRVMLIWLSYPVTLGTYSHPAWIGGWGHTSAATRVCADIQGFSDRWKLWGWLGSGQTPKFMLISNRHPSTGAMLIWMVCTIIQGQEGFWGWDAVNIMPRSVTLPQSEFRMGLNWC